MHNGTGPFQSSSRVQTRVTSGNVCSPFEMYPSIQETMHRSPTRAGVLVHCEGLIYVHEQRMLQNTYSI